MNTPDAEQPDESTLDLLKCVFPDGLSEAAYLPLLYILRKEMSIRAASRLVGRLMHKNDLEIYNDALDVNNRTHDQTIVEDLIRRLEVCDYKVWLDS